MSSQLLSPLAGMGLSQGEATVVDSDLENRSMTHGSASSHLQVPGLKQLGDS